MASENLTKPPRFGSEREEAEWWDNHPDFILREMERAKVEGRLGHGTAMRRIAERKAASDRTVELDQSDVEVATKLAQRKGVERSEYLKDLLHTALLREEEAVNPPPAA